jgi:hypothetical protein
MRSTLRTTKRSCDYDSGYIHKEAASRQEAKQLIELGFDYVMDKEGVSFLENLRLKQKTHNFSSKIFCYSAIEEYLQS